MTTSINITYSVGDRITINGPIFTEGVIQRIFDRGPYFDLELAETMESEECVVVSIPKVLRR